MQMFNGFTMWILRNYRINLDNGPEAAGNDPESNEALQGQNLQKIYEEINELNDVGKTDNDKIEIKWILTKEFSNYLEKNPTVATELLNAVNNLNFDNITDENVKNENERIKTDLQIFLKPILESVTINNQMEADSINGDEGKLYEKKGLTQEAVNNIKSKIDWLITSLWAQTEDENQKKTIYRNTLNNIKKVIEHPNSENTKALQKFILANLKDKTDFLKGNFKGWDEKNPDGLFGQATLDWVDAFLGVLKTSIDNIIAAEQVMDKNKPANAPSVVTDWGQDNAGNWDPIEVPETLEKPKAPTYPINGTLDGINKWVEGQRETWLWSQLVREKPERPEDEANIPDDKKLYETTKQLGELLNRINDKYAKIEWIKDNIISLKTNLGNIQDVINNTTVDNVRILQGFLESNLDETTQFKQSEFITASKKGGTYDGKFWKGTLAWLNAVLKKVDDYFKEVDTYLNQMDDYNKKQIDKIKWKNNVNKWETDAGKLVDGNLPAGATVNFKDGEQTKLNEPWANKEIKLVVTLSDGTEKEITVTVTVVDSPEQPGDAPAGPASIEIGDGDTKKTYQVVENSSTLATTLSIPWATFYYTTVPETENWWPDQENLWAAPGDSTQSDGELEPPKTGNIKEYYMQISGKSELYKIRLEDWFLYPIITKINPKTGKVKGKDLIANNDSCKCYLQNKLPNKIKTRCNIGWASKAQYWEAGDNYYLESYGQKLTIEPMSIAWDWISNDLWRNLAFINLTNYISDTWKKHKKPDPDVNRKVDKFRWIKDSNWSRLSINISDFWLDGATDEEKARFKRYNNGEHWDDNWNKKRKNKDYGRLVVNI